MKLGMAVVLAGCFIAGKGAYAQSPTPQPVKPAQQSKPPGESNPFPEDTNNVPVLSNGNAPAHRNVERNAPPAEAPSADGDPVRSPDDPIGNVNTDAQGFSSSASGIDNFNVPPDVDADQRRGKKGKAAPPPEHTESAAEDEKVGDYYLDQKNWKAALSRYESAVVLDPENPEVYWGMGEAQRHLGKFAEAKAAYEKLVEYDPDSKHGKEAKKILKAPEMANAPTASAKQP